MRNLLIEYRSNNTGHRDLYFQFGDYSCVADSYYLALDAEDDGPNGCIESILAQLLEKWLDVLQTVNLGVPVFLPFDFSDQFTRCLKCVKHEEDIEIQPGWSAREGWSVRPSNLGAYFYEIEDFHPESSAPIRLSQTEFLRYIEESVVQAKDSIIAETTLLSEAALNKDWNRPEEEEAWSHIQ